MKKRLDEKIQCCQRGGMILMIITALLVGFVLCDDHVRAEDIDPLCIEIDPGHGGEQTGAEAIDGITMEKDINLSLALALKEELDNYENINVYLTRTEDEDLDLEQRAEKALKDGADFMISIHHNAKGPIAPYDNGCTVLAANGNYRAALAKEEYKLSVNILHELSEAGLENQGIMIRDSEAGEFYDNGKIADYYGLIRAGILKKIPTIIIEHAFVDNDSEFEEFLSSDKKIKKLARADARGIARFFQLKHKKRGDILPALTDIKEKIVHVIDENGNHNMEHMEYFDMPVWRELSNFELSEQDTTENELKDSKKRADKGKRGKSMFCTNCGKEITENSKFCPKCGALVEDDNVHKVQKSSIIDDIKKGNKKAIGILAGGAAAVVVIVLLVVVLHKPTIDLADYTQINVTGAQGYGQAEVEFDQERFEQDILKVAKVNGKKVNTINPDSDILEDDSFLSELYGESSGIYNFALCISDVVNSGEFEDNGNLSNGDKVTYTYTFNNNELKKYGFKLKGQEITEEVSGLGEAEKIDPFDGVEVTFSGISPDVTAEYILKEDAAEEYSAISYSFDKSENLKSGDTVTLTAEADNSYLAQNYGVVLSETEKEYTVEGVQGYVTAADQIPTDILANMQRQAEDCISAYFAEHADYISVANTTYEGYYFLALKDMDVYGEQNKIYLIYSGTVRSKEEGGFAKTKVYFPIYFDNIMINADGTGYADISNASIQGSTDLRFSWWNLSGYTDKDKMLNDLVTADKGNYETAVVGEGLQ